MELIEKSSLRILDFDIENRPLSYWVPDKPTCEVTAIASCWFGEPRTMEVHLLGIDDTELMLRAFVERYNQADMVTGHYIRKHDLPIINGALMEFGMPNLQPKLASDTRLDMYSKGDIPATQEFLSELLGVPAPKVHMTQVAWRDANRLTFEGIQGTKRRVTGDVKQHMLLRQRMLELNLLKSPKMWRP